MMTLQDMLDRCYKEPTLTKALALMALFECERAIRQAKHNMDSDVRNPDGSQWDTCFEFLFKQVIDGYQTPSQVAG